MSDAVTMQQMEAMMARMMRPLAKSEERDKTMETLTSSEQRAPLHRR